MLHIGAERRNLMYAAAAVALAGILRYLDYRMQDRSWFLLADSMIYIAIIVGWAYSMNERVTDSRIRFYQRGIACAMVLFLLLRACRNVYFAEIPALRRICWYAYYLPSVMIPLYMAYTAFRTAGEPAVLKWPLKTVTAAGAMMVLAFLTNDLHGMVYRVQQSTPEEEIYVYGPLYLPCLVVPYIVLAASLVLMYRSKERRRREDFLFPAAVLGEAFLVTMVIPGMNVPDRMFRPFEAPILLVLACLAFSESCIAHGLIPSNDGRAAFFRKLGVPAILADADGQVRYRTENAGSLTEEEMAAAKTAPLQLPDGKVLKCAPVRGGFACWKEDLSEVRRLSKELKEAGERLAEEQALIGAENLQLETRLRTEAQNQLYDRIQEAVRDTLGVLRGIIETTDPEGEDFVVRMRKACFFGVNIKRRCNLLLLADENGMIRTEEMYLSVRELLSYLEMSGTAASFTARTGGMLGVETVLLSYDFITHVLDRGGQQMTAAMVTAEEDGEDMVVRIVTEEPEQEPDPAWERERISAAGGSTSFSTEDGSSFSMLRVGRGLA